MLSAARLSLVVRTASLAGPLLVGKAASASPPPRSNYGEIGIDFTEFALDTSALWPEAILAACVPDKTRCMLLARTTRSGTSLFSHSGRVFPAKYFPDALILVKAKIRGRKKRDLTRRAVASETHIVDLAGPPRVGATDVAPLLQGDSVQDAKQSDVIALRAGDSSCRRMAVLLRTMKVVSLGATCGSDTDSDLLQDVRDPALTISIQASSWVDGRGVDRVLEGDCSLAPSRDEEEAQKALTRDCVGDDSCLADAQVDLFARALERARLIQESRDLDARAQAVDAMVKLQGTPASSESDYVLHYSARETQCLAAPEGDLSNYITTAESALIASSTFQALDDAVSLGERLGVSGSSLATRVRNAHAVRYRKQILETSRAIDKKEVDAVRKIADSDSWSKTCRTIAATWLQKQDLEQQLELLTKKGEQQEARRKSVLALYKQLKELREVANAAKTPGLVDQVAALEATCEAGLEAAVLTEEDVAVLKRGVDKVRASIFEATAEALKEMQDAATVLPN